MDIYMTIEIIGYIGSMLVLVSFLMPSVVRLRIINSAGAVISAIYALIIRAYPTAVMNICLVGINIYYLSRLNKKDNKHFNMIKVRRDDTYLIYLLNYYKADIKKYFPEWDEDVSCIDTAFIVFCDTVPAGIFLGRRHNKARLDMIFEYAVPAYRDCSVGRYIYSQLSKIGIHELKFSGRIIEYEDYLQTMGFTKKGNCFVKILNQGNMAAG